MSLLEVIKNASTNIEAPRKPSKHPITIIPDSIISTLEPASETPTHFTLVEPLKGFKETGSEFALAESNAKFFKQLKRRLKILTQPEFTERLIAFLRQIGLHIGFVVVKESTDEVYLTRLLETVGHVISADVVGLLVDACIFVQDWLVLELLIVHGLVTDHRTRSRLISHLAYMKFYDFMCLCIKFFPDLNPSDIRDILKLFLNFAKEDRRNLAIVRKEWETPALAAVKNLDNDLPKETAGLAKDAAILLMLAYDDFNPNELCLHFLLSSANVDGVAFSSAISKLGIDEVLKFVGYLEKWLKKYDKFPQAVPCPEAATVLQLPICDWVPTIEDVVGCLGLVLDEHFSTMVLHSEFHEKLKSIKMMVDYMVAEGRLCSAIANLIEVLC